MADSKGGTILITILKIVSGVIVIQLVCKLIDHLFKKK